MTFDPVVPPLGVTCSLFETAMVSSLAVDSLPYQICINISLNNGCPMPLKLTTDQSLLFHCSTQECHGPTCDVAHMNFTIPIKLSLFSHVHNIMLKALEMLWTRLECVVRKE